MSLTLASRIFLGNAIVTLTFGAVSVFSVFQMRATGGEIRLVSEGYLAMAKATAQLDSFHRSRQRDTERLLSEESPTTRQALLKMAQGYFPQKAQERLGELVDMARRAEGMASSAEEAKLLRDLVERFNGLAALYAEYEDAARIAFDTMSVETGMDRGDERYKDFTALERKLGREIRVMALILDQQVAQRVQLAAANERKSTLVIIFLSILAICLGLMATFMARRLLSPVQTLTTAVRQASESPDADMVVPLDADGEIGLLARALDDMARARKGHEKALMEKQEALVRAERLAAIGRISAQITHEIRNPLTSIGLNAEMLEEELADGGDISEARSLLKSIIREVDRLGEISEQYLTFARFPNPVMAPLSTADFLDDLLDFHGPELTRAGVKIQRNYAADCPPVIGDESQLKQAILNLLRNSREALVHGGTIWVEAKPLVTQVELAIRDDGPGIPQEALKKMFDPFFSTKERGTGLGLSLTQQIIASHGGTLGCASELGRGTTFTIRLKRADVASVETDSKGMGEATDATDSPSGAAMATAPTSPASQSASAGAPPGEALFAESPAETVSSQASDA